MNRLEQTGLKKNQNIELILFSILFFFLCVFWKKNHTRYHHRAARCKQTNFVSLNRHSLFDCPSISKVKQMNHWSWQHLSQTSTVPMKIWLLSFLSGHTHAIVFRLPQVDAGHQPCDCVRGAQPRIWLTNICSFMVIFSRLCKHISLWQIVLPVPALLITLWRFANFQALFCLPVLNRKKKSQHRPSCVCNK